MYSINKDDTQENKRKGKHRILIRLLVLLVVAITVVVLLDAFTVDLVIVEGNTHYTDAQIISMMMTKKTDQISIFMVARHLMSETKIPFVEKIEVHMRNRSTIQIDVHEKRICGCIEVMNGYMFFDREGYIVESSVDRVDTIPLITGLQYRKAVMYEKLEVQSSSLYDTIMNLVKLLEKYSIAVEQIAFSDKLEITLYHESYVVRLAKKDFYDEDIATLRAVIDSAQQRRLAIDMRFYEGDRGDIIAKPLED